MTIMFLYEQNDRSISTETETFYERLASQEEFYLEEKEEELRMILISDDPSSRAGETADDLAIPVN